MSASTCRPGSSIRAPSTAGNARARRLCPNETLQICDPELGVAARNNAASPRIRPTATMGSSACPSSSTPIRLRWDPPRALVTVVGVLQLGRLRGRGEICRPLGGPTQDFEGFASRSGARGWASAARRATSRPGANGAVCSASPGLRADLQLPRERERLRRGHLLRALEPLRAGPERRPCRDRRIVPAELDRGASSAASRATRSKGFASSSSPRSPSSAASSSAARAWRDCPGMKRSALGPVLEPERRSL